MSGGAMPPSRDLRQLAASATSAEDAALLRLVRLLDGLSARGEADRVLDPVRPRLQALRPQRPLRFARLLFLPLDGAIVPPPRWRRGGHEIPRSAILPIAAAVEAAGGPEAAAIRREAEGHSTGEEAVIAALGARLWPAAAAALPEEPPPGWSEAGLAREDYAPIRAVAAPVLAAGVPIFAALRQAAQGPPADAVRAALAGPAQAGPLPLAAAIATLLRRATAPGGVLLAAAELGPAARALGSRMVDVAIEELPDPATACLQDAAAAATRFFAGATDLTASGLLDPERARRVLALRHAADEACRRRVTEAGRTEVVSVLAALGRSDTVQESDVIEVERNARAIRALAQVGRGVGDPAAYDRALRSLVDAIGALHAPLVPARPGGLSAVDLARVVEILAGPDAAEALLRRAPASG